MTVWNDLLNPSYWIGWYSPLSVWFLGATIIFLAMVCSRNTKRLLSELKDNTLELRRGEFELREDTKTLVRGTSELKEELGMTRNSIEDWIKSCRKLYS